MWFKDDALVLVHGSRNSASRVTQPEWARFQWTCNEHLGVAGALFPDLRRAITETPGPEFGGGRVHHVRFRVRQEAYWFLPGDDFVVVTIKPLNVERMSGGPLLVLTGTANHPTCNVEGYGQVVMITWAHDWQSNPTWLPRLLFWLAHSAMEAHSGARCDVLALSRGVQSR